MPTIFEAVSVKVPLADIAGMGSVEPGGAVAIDVGLGVTVAGVGVGVTVAVPVCTGVGVA